MSKVYLLRKEVEKLSCIDCYFGPERSKCNGTKVNTKSLAANNKRLIECVKGSRDYIFIKIDEIFHFGNDIFMAIEADCAFSCTKCYFLNCGCTLERPSGEDLPCLTENGSYIYKKLKEVKI